MKERTIKYTGKAIDVYFTVDRCTHVAECLRGAPAVFDVTRKPWVIADNDEPDRVAKVVISCPTGALHYKRKDGGEPEPIPEKNLITICDQGPYNIKGDIEIRNFDGKPILYDTRLALCRCGASKITPLCDGSHHLTHFENETKPPGVIAEKNPVKGKLIIILQKDGALDIQGPLEILTSTGENYYKGNRIRLCRCGASRKMPFCDASHKRSGFSTPEKVVLYLR